MKRFARIPTEPDHTSAHRGLMITDVPEGDAVPNPIDAGR